MVLLDKLAQRGSGHTPNQREPSYWNGGVKWVSLADSRRLDKGLIHDTDKQISALGIANSSAVLHPAGTVILSRDAGVGRSAILAEPMAVSQHFMAWRCGPELHNGYLYQVLQSLKPEFERIANGSTVRTIGLPYFKRLKVPTPPLASQVEIAETLGCWDQAIAVAEGLAKQVTTRRRALARSLLHTGTLQSEGAAGWQRVALHEVFERVTRRVGSAVPSLSISAGRGFLSQSERFGAGRLAAGTEHYTELRRNEFAYNKGNSKTYSCGCVYRLTDRDAAAVPGVYICFAAKREISPAFWDHYFEADGLKPELRRIINSGVRGDGLLNLDVDDFFRILIPLPPVEAQQALASVLTAAKAEEQLLEEEITALHEQKQALLRRLLWVPAHLATPRD